MAIPEGRQRAGVNVGMTGIQNMSSQLSPSTGMEFDASIYEGPQMKADEVIAMRTLFEACDTDGSGSIPLKELKSRLVVKCRNSYTFCTLKIEAAGTHNIAASCHAPPLPHP